MKILKFKFKAIENDMFINTVNCAVFQGLDIIVDLSHHFRFILSIHPIYLVNKKYREKANKSIVNIYKIRMDASLCSINAELGESVEIPGKPDCLTLMQN